MHLYNSKFIMRILAAAMMICLLAGIFAPVPANAATIAVNAPINLSRTQPMKVLLGEEFQVGYEITPERIPAATVNPPKQKEIFIVIDTSGSMDYNLDGKSTQKSADRRISIAKSAAKTFIDGLPKDGNIKIGLIYYSDTAFIKKELTTDFNSVKTEIDKLNAGGGTNIGDGLRRAYYKLINSGNSNADKYLIMLTDGEPTYHSVYKNSKTLFYEDGQAPSFNGGGSTSTPEDIQYCYDIAERYLRNSGIRSYMIAFTKGANQNVLKTTAQKANGIYKQALTSDALKDVYVEIADDIVSAFTVSNVIFEENIPEGLTIVAADGATVEGQKITRTFNNIQYNLNTAKTHYEASPIKYTIRLKGTVAGNYLLGANRSTKLTYRDINGSNQVKYFPQAPLEVKKLSASFSYEATVDNNNPISGQNTKIKYTIKPNPIDIDPSLLPARNKEIVLVIDTSWTMTQNIAGATTYNNNEKRITIAKNAALKFVDNLAGKDGIKVSLISYDDKAVIRAGLTSNLNDIKNKINSLNTSYGTNIGDGLRRAYYVLKNGDPAAEKYIVILSDGEPSKHSLMNGNSNYFMDDGDAPRTADVADKNKEYGYKVIRELIKPLGINTYFVAFTEDSPANIFEEMASIAGGTYKRTNDSDINSLITIYENISREIGSDFTVKNVNVEVTLPEGLSVKNAPGLTITGQTVSGTISDITYRYDPGTGKYIADPVSFEVEVAGVTVNDVKEYTIRAYVNYEDFDGESTRGAFPAVNIKVRPYEAPTLKVERVKKSGEKVDVTVKYTIPEFTETAKLRLDTTGEEIDVAIGDSEHTFYGLSMYKAHKATLICTSKAGETREVEITVYHGIDFN